MTSLNQDNCNVTQEDQSELNCSTWWDNPVIKNNKDIQGNRN